MKDKIILYILHHKRLDRFFSSFAWFRNLVIRSALQMLRKEVFKRLHDEDYL